MLARYAKRLAVVAAVFTNHKADNAPLFARLAAAAEGRIEVLGS